MLLFVVLSLSDEGNGRAITWFKRYAVAPLWHFGSKWLPALVVTPGMRAVVTKIIVAWAIGSWCLLFIFIFCPWWPSWKLFVENQVAQDEDDDDDDRIHATEDNLDEETSEQEIPKDWPCGLLLLTTYGLGL